MSQIEFFLANAITAEHKARTGHDGAMWAKDDRSRLRSISCDVCLWLRGAWGEIEKKHNEAIREEFGPEIPG